MGSVFLHLCSSSGKKAPERVTDLMGYQSLIIDALLEYKGDCWAGYDRRFRQQAVSRLSLVLSTNNLTFWSLAFTGCAKVSRCSYCFSLSHHSADCELARINHGPPAKPPGSSVFAGMNQPAPFPTASMTMYATYVLKTQETVMWPTELLTAHSVQPYSAGQYHHSSPKRCAVAVEHI